MTLTKEKRVLASIHRERLLNVVRALREDKDPENFRMYAFSRCGTPACALGHYAARDDLQHVFRLRKSGWLGLQGKRSGDIGIDSPAVQEHFGIDFDEADELFGYCGCDGARHPEEAARYIESFVEFRS